MRSIGIDLSPKLDAQVIGTVWTLLNSSAVPGAYIVKNVSQSLQMSANGTVITMTNNSGSNESFMIEVVGTTGYRFQTNSGQYILANSVLVNGQGTSGNATVFSFQTL
jgi:hypothetical protein